MTRNRARRILELLRLRFPMPQHIPHNRDSFETLIVTIISQNTADTNTARAFENLSKHFKIVPEVLAKAKTSEIEKCLKVGGLYRGKAKTIKQVSKIILDRFDGSLKPLLKLPLEEARESILQLPGVGPKTADVLLLFSAGKPTIPVDTHVNRVSKRLCLAPIDADKETVRRSLQVLFDPKDFLAVHILLISLGRKVCRARNPACELCPVNALCPSRRH